LRYQISGRHIDIGEALQTHVTTELGDGHREIREPRDRRAVIFSRDAHEFVCEATVHLSTGLTTSAKAHATEIYAAFDLCAAKMEKQLRRYKRRLKDHHRDRPEPVELLGGVLLYPRRVRGIGGQEPADLQPIIIAEMETRIPSLTVGEAVMQMELAGAPVLVFRNEKKGSGVNVVYRREDGNIGWIDPG
jgi:ribosomal subunit interface protein